MYCGIYFPCGSRCHLVAILLVNRSFMFQTYWLNFKVFHQYYFLFTVYVLNLCYIGNWNIITKKNYNYKETENKNNHFDVLLE